MKRIVSICIDMDLYNKMKQESDKTHRTVTSIITELLRSKYE